MNKKSSSSSSGIGFTGMLTILFIGLKLAKVINWSWWWVLSPIWISTGLVLIILGFWFVYELKSNFNGLIIKYKGGR